jgi:hypothetical protein
MLKITVVRKNQVYDSTDKCGLISTGLAYGQAL